MFPAYNNTLINITSKPFINAIHCDFFFFFCLHIQFADVRQPDGSHAAPRRTAMIQFVISQS